MKLYKKQKHWYFLYNQNHCKTYLNPWWSKHVYGSYNNKYDWQETSTSWNPRGGQSAPCCVPLPARSQSPACHGRGYTIKGPAMEEDTPSKDRSSIKTLQEQSRVSLKLTGEQARRQWLPVNSPKHTHTNTSNTFKILRTHFSIKVLEIHLWIIS